MHYLTAYLSELWHLTEEMAPYLLLGFLAAGLLKVYFPRELLIRYMGGNNARASLNASLLGVPMPLCSCGVLPAGISLHNNGASKSATTSFLISTPQTGADSILVTYAMLGLPMAVIRPIVALLTGFAGGMASAWFGKDETKPGMSGADENTPRTIAYMLRYAFVEFMADISRWLVYGLLVAALIAVLLPDDFFATTVSNPYLQMLLVLVASIPVYICATGSVPIAAVLLLKGISPGAVLVLLMAGPATNAASLTVLHKALGRRSTIIYLATIIIGALVAGIIVNMLPPAWFEPAHTHQHHHGLLPSWLGTTSAIVLVSLILNTFILKYRQKKQENSADMGQHQYLLQVEGMNCNHCTRSVENKLSTLEGVKSVRASFERNEVVIEGEGVDLEKVKTTIENLGYSYAGPKEVS